MVDDTAHDRDARPLLSSKLALGLAAVILLFSVGSTIAGFLVFKARFYYAYNETLNVEPRCFASGKRRSSGSSEDLFIIRPRGGNVRFFHGNIKPDEPVTAELLKRNMDQSVVIEDGVRQEFRVPVGSETAAFWALLNERSDKSIQVEFKLR